MQSIPAKIIIKHGSVYLEKNCPNHGVSEELLEEDAKYHLLKKEYDKPGTSSQVQTNHQLGCPFDCGLCPQHNQHTCIGLIEVTRNCDLNCPICFANAGTDKFLSLAEIERMMDFYQASEYGQAEILQLSGGEPTTHPQILDILRLAKLKKFKYIMLNTNGLRIATDEEFVKNLHQFSGGFEVYLQFDGFKGTTHQYFRGSDLTQIKRNAIEQLKKYEIPMTLVCTLENGINDSEIGEIITFGIKNKFIRGVNIQPTAYFGRLNRTKSKERLTISGILKRIEDQTKRMIHATDFVPLPCNVERVATTYLLKTDEGFIPITRNADIKKYLSLINNTFAFKVEDLLNNVKESFGNLNQLCQCMSFLKDFQKIVPKRFDIKAKDAIENTFRISITSFVDAYNFDIKSMQKECVHMITPDLKRIPFSAYNMIHRKDT